METVQVGSIVAGRRLDEVIGHGGMGVVYRATHLELGREEALKVISPGLASDPLFRDRFKRESRSAAAIHHPHIVTVYDAGEDEGRLYISMELIRGENLRQLLTDRDRLPPAEVVEILSQIAAALDAAHAMGLVHRDVKPANLLLRESDDGFHSYLADFGLTRSVGREGGLTQTGEWMGSVDYVPPEQIRGEKVDQRADTYALGAVIFEALSGEVPYPRDNDVAKMWAQVNEPPPSLHQRTHDLSEELSNVVQRAMAKHPADRYQSTGDFARAMEKAASGRTVGAKAEKPPPPIGDALPLAGDSPGSDSDAQPSEKAKRRRFSPRRWLFVAELLVIAVVLFLVFGSGGEEPDEAKATEASVTVGGETIGISYGSRWYRIPGTDQNRELILSFEVGHDGQASPDPDADGIGNARLGELSRGHLVDEFADGPEIERKILGLYEPGEKNSLDISDGTKVGVSGDRTWIEYAEIGDAGFLLVEAPGRDGRWRSVALPSEESRGKSRSGLECQAPSKKSRLEDFKEACRELTDTLWSEPR